MKPSQSDRVSDLAAELDDLLRGVGGDIARARDHRALAGEVLAPGA